MYCTMYSENFIVYHMTGNCNLFSHRIIDDVLLGKLSLHGLGLGCAFLLAGCWGPLLWLWLGLWLGLGLGGHAN